MQRSLCITHLILFRSSPQAFIKENLSEVIERIWHHLVFHDKAHHLFMFSGINILICDIVKSTASPKMVAGPFYISERRLIDQRRPL